MVQGATDMPALRLANSRSNAEQRARHAADPDMNTGHTFIHTTWKTGTRGEKLRTNHHHQLRYTAQLGEMKKRVEALKARLKRKKNAKKEKELAPMKADVALLERMLVLCARFHQMLLNETNDDWYWEEGLEDQKLLRCEQNDIFGKLNQKFEDLGLDDGPLRRQALGMST